ncbi:unnamed protein product [Peronospora farinosa]|uniref:PDZ domain-containing protein n=1 Tax=Peronospora farinosa TaxID=134698 RepID=A0ABN8CHH5_9STRA|nr:unnamed protein product [Peronospora farinosa]
MMEESTVVSPVKPHVESPQSIENVVVAAMRSSIPIASDMDEREKSLIRTQQETHQLNEDGIESDKAHTDTDNEEEMEQHKKEQHKEVMSTLVETLIVESTSLEEENGECKTSMGQPLAKDIREKDVCVAMEEQSEKNVEVDVQKETIEEQKKENVAEVVWVVQSPLQSTAVKTVAAKEVEVHSEMKVQNEVELKVVPKVQNGIKAKVQNEVVPKVQNEVVPEVQDEIKAKVQDEVVPKAQDQLKAKVQDEVVPKVQDEPKAKVQNEVVHKDQPKAKVQEDEVFVPKVQDQPKAKVQDDEVFVLKAQDELKGNVQDEVVPKVQNEADTKVQDKEKTTVLIMEAEEHEVELVISSPKRLTPLNLVHHDIDDEESDSEDEEEEVAPREAEEEGADLGTPLGYGGGANFDEEQADFASHRFLGPSVATDPSSVRALHSLRRVALHDKPPRFVSEAPVITARTASLTSSGESSGRNSSSATVTYTSDGLRSQSEAGFVENMLNTYTLTFTEPVLGFDTNIVMSLENELMVEVWSVEKDSPAQRGGVVVGDNLISVNGQHIEPHMTKEQVLKMIEASTIPRTLLFQRDMHDKDPSQSKSLPDKKLVTAKPLMGRLGAAMSQGASLIGSRLKRKKTLVHENSFCDGCGMDPITGALWTCSVCSNYNLCNECYDVGTHGMENTEQMQALNEAIVQYKLQKKCKHFTPEFFLSLRRDICKGRPDKFEYLGEWIANIVVGTSTAKITVRGIEIPSLPPAARQRFVSHLMPLVSNRTDIEVNIEWLPDEADPSSAAGRPSVDRMSVGVYGSEEEDDDGVGNVPDNLEKLRIWISDKKTRTTSPFA